MLYPKNQNWRTSQKFWDLSLANSVNTGVTFNTSSGTIANQHYWNSVGFRGLGPTLTFPAASLLHGCGCNGGTNNIIVWGRAGVGVYFLIDRMISRGRHGD